MKKVLIIGHFWPYRGGSKRVVGLAKYLKEFGWEPIILTGPLKQRPAPEFRFIETGYLGFLGRLGKLIGVDNKANLSDQLKEKLDRKNKFSAAKPILRFIYQRVAEVFAFPDEDKYWKKISLEAISQLFQKEKIDAIISVWPVTSHLIAKDLKNEHKIPWIADFPDLWSQNFDYSYSFIRKMFDRKLERETLMSTDVFTTVSLPMKKRLEKLYSNKKVFAITLGFDPKKVNTSSIKLTKKFTVTYTGLICRKKQDPLKILIALKDLIAEKIINPNEIEVRFYGPEDYLFEKKIKKNNLDKITKQYGVVSKEESLQKQWESQLLLSLNWEDKKEKGIYTGKIFEYLAARRPILATGGFGKDVVEDLLKETNAGAYAATINDIKRYLEKFYLEYKQKGKVSYEGDTEKIDKYSHHQMAKKFADILNKLI